jgi:hypothetical protein
VWIVATHARIGATDLQTTVDCLDRIRLRLI